METRFKIFYEGEERDANVVTAIIIDNKKYMLYELDGESDPDGMEIINVARYVDDSDPKKPVLLPISDEELEKVKKRLDIILQEID